MEKNTRFNLVGVAWPLCLMKCNLAVRRMNPGDRLEVMIKDADVVAEMVRLITRTGPCRVEVEKHPTYISLHVTRLEGSRQ